MHCPNEHQHHHTTPFPLSKSSSVPSTPALCKLQLLSVQSPHCIPSPTIRCEWRKKQELTFDCITAFLACSCRTKEDNLFFKHLTHIILLFIFLPLMLMLRAVSTGRVGGDEEHAPTHHPSHTHTPYHNFFHKTSNFFSPSVADSVTSLTLQQNRSHMRSGAH